MKKLRLIKPWQLRTILQRIDYVHEDAVFAQLAPCSGPQGSIEEVCYSRTACADIRAVKKIMFPSFHGAHAPHSDVIFVSGCNQKIR